LNGISGYITVHAFPRIYLEVPHNMHNESIKFIFTKEYGNFAAYINAFNGLLK